MTQALEHKAFELEVKALMKIKAMPHLTSALTAFKYQNKYHLVSKWSEGGNLADFWRTQPPSLEYESICWFAQQCRGLADGLYSIHDTSATPGELQIDGDYQGTPLPKARPGAEHDKRIHGRHGDIKPQNILWFRDDPNRYNRGVLKITDFDVAAFHTALTTEVSAEKVQNTRTYAAPEIDASGAHDKPRVSRKFDVWSLGCVYVEFITWIILGNEKLETFADKRMAPGVQKTVSEDTFYTVHKRKWILLRTEEYVTAKKSVVRVSRPFELEPLMSKLMHLPQWIRRLKDHKDCSRFLREFLIYIQEKMLVDKEERDSSALVREKLRVMSEECEQNPAYASKRSGVRKEAEIRHRGEVRPQVSRWRKIMSMSLN